MRTQLEAHKVPFDVIDVAQDSDALDRMRELVGDEEALAPQIANGDEYCGVSWMNFNTLTSLCIIYIEFPILS